MMTQDSSESEAESRYIRRIHDLDAFGHRASATPNEHLAADYILQQLRSAGIEADKESFRGSRSSALRLLIHVLLAACGLALRWRVPLIAEVWVAGVFGSLVAEQMTLGVWLSWIVCQFKSHNVVGRVPATRAPRLRLVVCAHYDTQKSGWIWDVARWLLPVQIRSPLLLEQPLLILVLLMIVQLAAGAVTGHAKIQLVAEFVLWGGYGIVAVLLVQWACAPAVPGAADNASGVAAALEIAERWRHSPAADDVELLVLLPGCEESGLLGAAAWAARNRARINAIPTFIVNIDGIGFGPPRFLGAEVPAVGIPLHVPSQLTAACREVARGQNLADAGPHALPGPTDSLAFLARGLLAVSIVGFREGHRLPHYHTAGDTSGTMDFANARAGTTFAAAVVRKLAAAPGNLS